MKAKVTGSNKSVFRFLLLRLSAPDCVMMITCCAIKLFRNVLFITGPGEEGQNGGEEKEIECCCRPAGREECRRVSVSMFAAMQCGDLVAFP